jgi:ESX-1-secreted protein regulator
MATLAERLNRLFDTVRRPDGEEYGNTAVAEAIRTDQGLMISHTYVWQLRTGRRDNPTIQHMTALAKFFGVPVAYFLDDAEMARINKDLDLLASLRNAGVTEIALRTAKLSPDAQDAVSDLVARLWKMENGPDK